MPFHWSYKLALRLIVYRLMPQASVLLSAIRLALISEYSGYIIGGAVVISHPRLVEPT